MTRSRWTCYSTGWLLDLRDRRGGPVLSAVQKGDAWRWRVWWPQSPVHVGRQDPVGMAPTLEEAKTAALAAYREVTP